MRRIIWKLRCAIHLIKRLRLPPKQAYQVAESLLDDIDGDLTECPIYCANEEVYCWAADSQ